MISKNQISFVKSLSDKKFRLKYGCFIAEGNKICTEVLNSDWQVEQVYATELFCKQNKSTNISKIQIVTDAEIKRLSSLLAPTDAIAVVKIPSSTTPNFTLSKWSLALDGVQDPGNFGTIIRTAEWFGIQQIFASMDCADLYNSKTIQATMGSFLRTPIFYTDLKKLIELQNFKTIAGAVMNGKNIAHEKLPASGLMILGNEGKGISSPILSSINTPVTIAAKGKAESLNVAVAAGIICNYIG
jgi:TrmH family RNA methyltransferase